MITRVRLDRRGSVAAATALFMLGLVGSAGLAFDLTRVWMVSARLKSGVDAAALLAARQIGQTGQAAQATEMFWSNWTGSGGPSGSRGKYIGATITAGPTITPIGTNRIRITASATVPTTLFSIIAKRNDIITETAVAQRAATGLELALVIDQTSSMRLLAGGGKTKLQAAQAAVQTMLDVLYGSNDAQESLWVSVVPFARTINIGTSAQAQAMLSTTGMPAEWSVGAWSGCVEARTNGDDITDAAPISAPFQPYFWRSTYHLVGMSSQTSKALCRYKDDWSSNNNNSSNNAPGYCFGDNDWGASVSHETLMTNPNYSYLIGLGMTQTRLAGPQASGPNHLCALTPLMPLTASRTTVQGHVNSITAPPKSGGTALLTGMQGAWYTLSPNFQGSWPSTNPAGTPSLPLAYNTRNMRKAVVLLSDGDNNWQLSDVYDKESKGSTRGSATVTELNYSAYGRAADWNARFQNSPISPVTEANAGAQLDIRTAATCQAMRDLGIIIYFIGFEVQETAHRTLLTNCATSPQHYFESPSTAQLQAVFTTIANQLTSLRLAE